MNRATSVLLHGAVAGLLAATALVLYFLIWDRALHAPLRTPTFLAAAILGVRHVQPDVGAILLYTLVHYIVFVLIGLLVAWVVGQVPMARSLLFGVVVGFLLFDLLFYAGIIVSGTNVIRALGWPIVLLGTIVAGLVMLGSLALTSPARGTGWIGVLREHRTTGEGIVAGAIGATIVAFWFMIVDAFAGRMLFTPAALGSAVFYGATSPAQVTVDFTTVAGYTLLHYAAFLVVGLIFAAVVRGTEESPPLLLGLAMLFVVAETLFVGLVAIAASWILGTFAWWAIIVGNVLAAIGMGAYLWKMHPALQNTMRGPLERPA